MYEAENWVLKYVYFNCYVLHCGKHLLTFYSKDNGQYMYLLFENTLTVETWLCVWVVHSHISYTYATDIGATVLCYCVSLWALLHFGEVFLMQRYMYIGRAE